MPVVDVVTVFAAAPGGGNPVPIVTDAENLGDLEMQSIAADYGMEVGFVLQPDPGTLADFSMRYWVPRHEMTMCGHATIGAIWVLYRKGVIARDTVTIGTPAGTVRARSEAPARPDSVIEISQPAGQVVPLSDGSALSDLARALNIELQLIDQLNVANACTTRVKTLVPLPSESLLDSLQPNYGLVEEWCNRYGSTGLYPYSSAAGTGQGFVARQFPQSSGYAEDPATGIAAAALAYGLVDRGLVDGHSPIKIGQGFAMNRPSEITVRFERDDPTAGCWVGGPVSFSQ